MWMNEKTWTKEREKESKKDKGSVYVCERKCEYVRLERREKKDRMKKFYCCCQV